MNKLDLTPPGYYASENVKVYATPQEWESVVNQMQVGDTIKVPCMDGIYTFRLVGINQEMVSNNTTNYPKGLKSFICEELFTTNKVFWNVFPSNIGSWQNSNIREFCQMLLSTFPPSLQAAIKPVLKRSLTADKQKSVVTYDKIWAPSVSELYGQTQDFADEGSQYTYYVNRAVTATQNYQILSRNSIYWTRSVDTTESELKVGVVNADGGLFSSTVQIPAPNGVAPMSFSLNIGFCI